MKWFSHNNLVSVLTTLASRYKTFSSAVNNTFAEVYENLEYLESLCNGCTYDEAEEMLTVPIALGTVVDEILEIK